MGFIEIAFQAEISRYEDSEFEEYAKRHCNEDPDTRGKAIEELRRMIRERGECNPRRTDDAYLLRFLRCRRSIPALAHKLMVRYEDFQRQNAYLYDCDPFELVQVKNVYAGILPESPDNGRVILMRFGRWDVDAVPIEDVVRLALAMDEIAVMQPKLQILGVTIVVDLDGLNLRQVAQLTPTVAGQIVSLMGMVRYEDFQRQNAYLYDCDPFELVQVKNVYAGILPESPDNGRVILMRFGRWDVDAVPIEDVVRLALAMDEIAVMQPKLQILGVTIVVDLDGLNLRQVAQLTPTVAGQIVSLMGVSFPLPNHSLHIIRYSWILHSIFYLFKQFMPKAVWSRIHFHGNDVSSLHKHIDPEYLPPELGGRCRHVISTEKWLSKINEYKDDYLVQELKDLGFNVKR